MTTPRQLPPSARLLRVLLDRLVFVPSDCELDRLAGISAIVSSRFPTRGLPARVVESPFGGLTNGLARDSTTMSWLGPRTLSVYVTARSAPTACALRCSLEEQITLAHITRERGRALEFCASLAKAAKLL